MSPFSKRRFPPHVVSDDDIASIVADLPNVRKRHVSGGGRHGHKFIEFSPPPHGKWFVHWHDGEHIAQQVQDFDSFQEACTFYNEQ